VEREEGRLRGVTKAGTRRSWGGVMPGEERPSSDGLGVMFEVVALGFHGWLCLDHTATMSISPYQRQLSIARMSHWCAVRMTLHYL